MISLMAINSLTGQRRTAYSAECTSHLRGIEIDFVDGPTRKILEWRERHEAYQILEDNKMKLHELAKFLYERETITGEEFMYILNKPAEISTKEEY